MYDYLCTDLSVEHPAFRLLGRYPDRLVSYPIQSLSHHPGRCLFLSDHAQHVEQARMLGFGTLLVDETCSEQTLLPYLSWVDPPVCASHTLFMFDLGNVVIKNITMLGKIARRYELDREAFFQDYLHYEFPLMEGVVSSAVYWDHVYHQFGIQVEGDPFFDAFDPIPNEEMLHLIKRLRSEGKRVVCASNTIDPHWKKMEAMGILSLFDATYASHKLALTKPSERFFTTILERERVDREAVYFIDDYELNIEHARKLGLASLLYADGIGLTASERLAEAFGER
ncbi:MAG: HAD family hydrolase [Sphaerochaeta sp.]|uniref:HAD family hydrolase n=1 Tax=Sphaerochaeta sp. TaxID=1972642 RepID=UPI002FCA4373